MDKMKATLLWCGVNVFGAVSSGVYAAGDGGGWRVEELLFHVGLFDEHTRRPQQNYAVEHLQSDHPVDTENINTHVKDDIQLFRNAEVITL